MERKMNRPTEKRKASQHTSSSALDDSLVIQKKDKEPKPNKKKVKQGNQESVSILKHFSPCARTPSLNTDGSNGATDPTEADDALVSSEQSSQPLFQSPDEQSPTLSDIMKQLFDNGSKIDKLSKLIEKMEGAIFTLQIENEGMRKEITDMKKREDNLKTEVNVARHQAMIADERSNFLEQYSRNYNLRLYQIGEPERETPEECEHTILKLFHQKLGLKEITKKDLDAVHRLGTRKEGGGPRGIIVRFVSRKTRDCVIKNRNKLKKQPGQTSRPVIIVEDLTKRNYILFSKVRQSPQVKECWTKMGTVFVKTNSGTIMQIRKVSDLENEERKSTLKENRHLRKTGHSQRSGRKPIGNGRRADDKGGMKGQGRFEGRFQRIDGEQQLLSSDSESDECNTDCEEKDLL